MTPKTISGSENLADGKKKTLTNAERQKAFRARKRNAQPVTGVTQRNAPAVTDGNADVDTASRMELMREVVALRAEVARLKRELAGRAAPWRPDARLTAMQDAAGERQDCLHGAIYGRCQVLGCAPAPKKRQPA